MKHIYQKVMILITIFLASTTAMQGYAQALTSEEKKLYNQNILYYDLESSSLCTTKDPSAAVPPGQGPSDGLVFPNLDPSNMSQAINQYILKASPNSRMKGLGDTIVASAKASNISPFLIVGIAQKESGIADPNYGDGWNVINANNSFGRAATSSQPHKVGSRLWYYWTSIKASVDSTAPENLNKSYGGDIAAYIRNVYEAQLNTNDISAFMNRYAPPSDGNDTVGYIASLKKAIDEMVSLAGGQTSAPTTPVTSTATNASCCLPSNTVDGTGNKAIIWNYLISTLKFSNIQAAGIMGNMQQESGFSPNAKNPSSGAFGIAQWLGGRLTGLQNFAGEQNKSANDIGLQLDFLAKELNGSYKIAVFDKIKASSNLAEVTRIWLERYEVPCLPGSNACDQEMDVRLPFADKILGEFSGNNPPTVISSPSTNGTNCSSPIADAGPVTLKQLSTYLNSPGGTITPKGITLHWWGNNGDGGIDFLVRALRTNTSCGSGGCSVQLGITKEGEVYQMTRSLTDLTYHATGANNTTIGIEIEGGPGDFGQNGIQKYPQKFNAVVATVQMLISKYNIPVEGSANCGSVSGIHPHKAYNTCARQTKSDIDDYYFNQVISKVGP